MEIRQAISMYLTAKAYKDAEFRVKFENPAKNLDECVLFLQAKMLERVTEEQRTGGAACVIPSDDEVFALAEQYYLDEDLKVDGDTFSNVRVLSIAATTFTDEEKAKMRQEAIEQYKSEVIAEQRKKSAKPKKASDPILVPDTPSNKEQTKKPVQLSLFDNYETEN